MSALITGNTYPVRGEMRELGGKWSKPLKGWLVPDDKADEARALVSNAPDPGTRRYADRARKINHFRFSSGAEAYQNANGRCEDAPCCGCCT